MSENGKERWTLIARLSAIAGLIVSLSAAWAVVSTYRPASQAELLSLKQEIARAVSQNRRRIIQLEPMPVDEAERHRRKAQIEELDTFIAKLEGQRIRTEFGLR